MKITVGCPYCGKDYEISNKKLRRYICACGKTFWFVCDGTMTKGRVERDRPAWATADYLSNWLTTDLR